MDLKKARQLRFEYLNLIGQRAKNAEANIYDIIVVPNEHSEQFFLDYRFYLKEVSNDEMLQNYSSKDYSVHVIYDFDPEFVNVYEDNISDYLKSNL